MIRIKDLFFILILQNFGKISIWWKLCILAYASYPSCIMSFDESHFFKKGKWTGIAIFYMGVRGDT